MKITGKVAVITGGNSGIGKAIAHALAKEGARIVIGGRRKAQNDEVAEDLRVAYGVEVLSVEMDVSVEQECVDMIARAKEQFGRVDILVNSAGVVRSGAVDELGTDEFDLQVKANLYGAYYCAREGFRAMKENEEEEGVRGYIINISSVAGVGGFAGMSAYCASKYGLMGLNDAMKEEGKEFGIKVSAICPSWVGTPMVEGKVDFSEALLPEDIAETVLYFLRLSSKCLPEEVVLRLRGL